MYIVSIDSSTHLASIALADDDSLIAESLFCANKALSARLIPELERMLAAAALTMGDIGLFACSIGPGSFTGVRAGVATVQGLSLATGKPCAGFSTLALIAMNFPLSPLPVCTMLDARKDELFAALHDCSSPLPTMRIEECVMKPEIILERIQAISNSPVIFAGDGALRYRELITARMGGHALFAPPLLNSGRAANGALLALHRHRYGQTVEPEQLLPVYLRPAEAEYAKIDRQNSRQSR